MSPWVPTVRSPVMEEVWEHRPGLAWSGRACWGWGVELRGIRPKSVSLGQSIHECPGVKDSGTVADCLRVTCPRAEGSTHRQIPFALFIIYHGKWVPLSQKQFYPSPRPSIGLTPSALHRDLLWNSETRCQGRRPPRVPALPPSIASKHSGSA